MKKTKENFVRKIKLTGYTYPPGFQYSEAGGHLKLRSCLHDTIIIYASSIGKYINKHELYRQSPPRIVKDTNMNEI